MHNLGQQRQASTSTGSPGCSWCRSGTAATSSPRPRRSRPRSWRSSRSGRTRTRSAIELADRLAAYAPGDLNRVFFTTGGGEAVETAWKLAKQYFKLTGKPTKHKVISRAIAYHGTPQGALSITGIPAAKETFEPLVPGAFKVPNTNFYRAPEHLRDDAEAFGLWAADRIAEAIHFEGPDTVAAVFLEPVQNSGGCFPPPPGYFERVREICDRVRRAAGLRRGDLRVRPDRRRCSPATTSATCPDIITCAKGMTVRLLPDRRDDRQRPAVRAVRHGTTFVPARLHVRRAPGLGGRGAGQPRHLRARGPQRPRATNAPAFRATLEKLLDLPIVGDVRGEGYFYGIELVKDKATRETFDDDESERLLRGFLSKALFDAGLYCRADDRGDPVIQLAPPLIVGPPEFDEIPSPGGVVEGSSPA